MSLQLPLPAGNCRLVILHEDKGLHMPPKTLNFTFPFRTDEVRTCRIDLAGTFVEPIKGTQSQSHGPQPVQALKLGGLPCALAVMEVLIVLFLTLWFLSEVNWESGASTRAEEIHKTRVSIVPWPLSCKQPSACPMSAETQWAHKAKEFSNREADTT